MFTTGRVLGQHGKTSKNLTYIMLMLCMDIGAMIGLDYLLQTYNNAQG